MQKKAMIHINKRGPRAMEITREHGGEILADYGTSILVRVAEEGLQALGAEGFRVREYASPRRVRLAGFELDTTMASASSEGALATATELPSGRSHHIVQLIGPMHPDWKNQMERMGAQLIQNFTEMQYLVEIATDRLNALAELAFVETVTPYWPALKVNEALLTDELQTSLADSEALHPVAVKASAMRPAAASERPTTLEPRPSTDPEKEGNTELMLFHAGDLLDAVDAVRRAGGRVIKAAGEAIVAYAPTAAIPKLAAIAQVREVNPYRPPALANHVAMDITHIDTLQNDHGLDGRGQVIGIADSGLDTGVNDASMLADFQGRIVRIHALGRPGDASDLHNHGTHVAGSALGDGTLSNGRIVGMAPAARFVFQSTMDATRGLGGIPTDLRTGFFDVARDDGAHIHTNSWSSSPTNGNYLPYARQADDFAFNNREFLILFAAGNDAPSRVNSPGSAKNVLTVGSSESNRPLPGSVNFPGGWVLPDFDEQADDPNDVAEFSCPGPARNERRKPDVVAPGTFILSTRSSVSTDDRGPDGFSESGDEDGVFTHEEAVGLGLPGAPILGTGSEDTPDLPAGAGPLAAENYYFSNGTSMSAPITAGACALVRQYLVEQRGHTPSAALIKAIVINGAVDMGMGVFDNGQGWGRIDLTNALFPPETGRIQFDDTLDRAVATGQSREYDVFVSSPAQPLCVTLVWRDPAGSTIQNRLHLRVVHVDTGDTYTSDDIANIRNNVQKVVVDPPAVGHYRIEVEGVNVSVGVPELGGVRQDYALVVANAMNFSCQPSDVVQVLDRSGSMGFSGYMEPAKNRAKQLIDLLQINDQAGVVTFASGAAAGDPMPLTPILSQADKTGAHDLIQWVSAGGATDLREALEEGMATLGPDTGRPRAMVMLSDGRHTVATPAIDNPFLDAIAAANIRVYTISLGPDSDIGVLNQIAARTGTGSVYSVASSADLHHLSEIYFDIIGGMGCGGVAHLSSDAVAPEKPLTRRVAIDGVSRQALFAYCLNDPEADIQCRLTDPDGQVHDVDGKTLLGYRGETHGYYRVQRPKQGIWKMRIMAKPAGQQASVMVTTAAMADSAVECHARLDPKYLYRGFVLLSLSAKYKNRPILKGKATAEISFPTVSIEHLLDQYKEQLKEITVDPADLKEDQPEMDRIKLDLLARRMRKEGKDIFKFQKIQLKLTDDGRQKDPRADDGIYTAFFNPQDAKVAGNFRVRIHFEAEDERFGKHAFTRLLPVCVPSVKPEVGIKRIFVRRNRRWRHLIIGAVVVKGDGTPATPADGTRVRMTVTQGRYREVLENAPYHRRGRYYIWRFRRPGFRPGKAEIKVTAKMAGKVAKLTKVVEL